MTVQVILLYSIRSFVDTAGPAAASLDSTLPTFPLGITVCGGQLRRKRRRAGRVAALGVSSGVASRSRGNQADKYSESGIFASGTLESPTLNKDPEDAGSRQTSYVQDRKSVKESAIPVCHDVVLSVFRCYRGKKGNWIVVIRNAVLPREPPKTIHPLSRRFGLGPLPHAQ